jgi:hypothetical protein
MVFRVWNMPAAATCPFYFVLTHSPFQQKPDLLDGF